MCEGWYSDTYAVANQQYCFMQSRGNATESCNHPSIKPLQRVHGAESALNGPLRAAIIP